LAISLAYTRAMRLRRFFIEEHLRNKREIALFEDEIIHQLKDVFRLRSGDKIILLDNSGLEYIAEIVLLAKGKAELKLLDTGTAVVNIPKKEVWLFASLIKKDNYEWILEKCTELGVSHFVPILSDRSEKKDLNIERAEKILKEASEQSGRGMMPVLHEILDLEHALNVAEQEKINLVAFHTVSSMPFDSSLRDSLRATKNPIGFLVGPEGGWSEKEVELFKSKNISIYSLGNQVLRAETAAIAISSLLLL
jgi:16S rRNA (uracil1498-N3)-methyltransferase